ncbi:hypothetical protein EVAR_7111_1 [Eumeta japonica]|uniref:Uncharacterized protein n=1 Tax=Eumeta variegata TaxID=151549 RepID=A0A4C1U6I6_EUMVA|nr:hypothetical protein EVAR_7111_1 [Eumeta japonica]
MVGLKSRSNKPYLLRVEWLHTRVFTSYKLHFRLLENASDVDKWRTQTVYNEARCDYITNPNPPDASLRHVGGPWVRRGAQEGGVHPRNRRGCADLHVKVAIANLITWSHIGAFELRT